MAQETVYWDDLKLAQGEKVPAVATDFEITIDGKTSEIDLGEENLAELHKALAPFIGAARKAGTSNVVSIRARRNAAAATTTTTTTRPKVDKEQNEAIRDWARRNGFKVSDRGRIAAPILEAFHNRDAKTGEPAANETAPRTDPPSPKAKGKGKAAAAGPVIRYAATKQEFRTAALAWARAKGMTVSPRGFGIAPGAVQRFIAESGLHRPLESADTKTG